MRLVTCYPTPGKEKARIICERFAQGVNAVEGPGAAAVCTSGQLEDGAAFFFGVTPATAGLWHQAKAEGRDWYYADNAYFHEHRGNFFRVTRNRLQHTGLGKSNGARFRALDLDIYPWRRRGAHVCIAPQSDEFMRVVVGFKGAWASWAIQELYPTERELRLLPWNRQKDVWYAALPANLVECWALVTFSSASALSAIMAGVPAIVTAEDCVLAHACRRELAEIENPPMPENREEIANVIADNQWTTDEMRSGLTWRALRALV